MNQDNIPNPCEPFTWIISVCRSEKPQLRPCCLLDACPAHHVHYLNGTSANRWPIFVVANNTSSLLHVRAPANRFRRLRELALSCATLTWELNEATWEHAWAVYLSKSGGHQDAARHATVLQRQNETARQLGWVEFFAAGSITALGPDLIPTPDDQDASETLAIRAPDSPNTHQLSAGARR